MSSIAQPNYLCYLEFHHGSFERSRALSNLPGAAGKITHLVYVTAGLPIGWTFDTYKKKVEALPKDTADTFRECSYKRRGMEALRSTNERVKSAAQEACYRDLSLLSNEQKRVLSDTFYVSVLPMAAFPNLTHVVFDASMWLQRTEVLAALDMPDFHNPQTLEDNILPTSMALLERTLLDIDRSNLRPYTWKILAIFLAVLSTRNNQGGSRPLEVLRLHGLHWVKDSAAAEACHTISRLVGQVHDLALGFECVPGQRTSTLAPRVTSILGSAPYLRRLEISYFRDGLEMLYPLLEHTFSRIWARLDTLVLRGLRLNMETFKVFLLGHKKLRHLTLSNIDFDAGSWIEFLIWLNEHMELESITLEHYLGIEDGGKWFVPDGLMDTECADGDALLRRSVEDFCCRRGPCPFTNDRSNIPEPQVGDGDNSVYFVGREPRMEYLSQSDI